MLRSTAQEIYAQTVRELPAQEQLRLAALILEELTRADPPSLVPVENGAAWTEQDQADVTAFSLRYAASIYPEEEDEEALVESR